MLKKLLITISAIVAVILVLVIVASVIVYTKVNKAFISAQMSKALNRQVYIEKIDAGIFSVLSGIEIKNVAISNFKTPQQLEAMQGKPVADGDVFAGMEALRFKIKILPLLSRQLELKELVLYSPVINLSKSKQGVMNIDDLIKSKKPQVPDKKDSGHAKPISADDIPVAITVGEIGMKNGTINYHDGEFDQNIQIYKLTILAYDINIDPKNLENKDEVKVNLGMGIKTVGPMKSGSVENFDVTIDATGRVIPFDVKTRILEPDVRLHISVPDGEITGLQIFKAVTAIPVLGDYLGEQLVFLKEKQQWKGSNYNGLDLRYKAARAEITNGRLELKEAGMLFDGVMNIDTKAINMNMGITMNKEINESVKASLARQIESAIKSPEVKKYASPAKLAEIAMIPLLNQDGRIDLKANVGGTTRKPEVKLTKPQLGSLNSIIKDNTGSLAVEVGKSAAKQLLKGDQQKVIEDVEGLFKK
jgi:hypothetical protein